MLAKYQRERSIGIRQVEPPGDGEIHFEVRVVGTCFGVEPNHVVVPLVSPSLLLLEI